MRRRQISGSAKKDWSNVTAIKTKASKWKEQREEGKGGVEWEKMQGGTALGRAVGSPPLGTSQQRYFCTDYGISDFAMWHQTNDNNISPMQLHLKKKMHIKILNIPISGWWDYRWFFTLKFLNKYSDSFYTVGKYKVLFCLFTKHLRVCKYNVCSQKWYIKKLKRLFFSYKLPSFIYHFW